MIQAPSGGAFWWVTPDPNPRFALPEQLVTDPATGQVAVWSSGSPLLDGAFLAAEVLLRQLFPFYLGDSGGGLFIEQPEPRLID